MRPATRRRSSPTSRACGPISTFTAGAGVGVRASDGKLMFRYDRAANRAANITTPVFFDNKVFFTSAYDTGAGLLRCQRAERHRHGEEVYFTREMKNHHGGVVLVNGYLYGFDDSILTCLEFATGKRMWRDRSVGKGAVTYRRRPPVSAGRGHTSGWRRRSPSGYGRRGASRFPTRGFRAGRTRWSAAADSTCVTRIRWWLTTSRRNRGSASTPAGGYGSGGQRRGDPGRDRGGRPGCRNARV